MLAGLNSSLVTVLLAGVTAFVTALVAAPVRLGVDKRLQRSKVAVEYEYEQRRALRTKIGAYHGRILEAALDLNYRLANLRKNWAKDWLDIKGEYRSPAGNQYYFRTTVYRFVLLEGLASRFEREAVFVDARIADGHDESFVLYAKAFRWVMTDVALFGDLEYNASRFE